MMRINPSCKDPAQVDVVVEGLRKEAIDL